MPYSDAYAGLQATLGRDLSRTGTADAPDTSDRVDYVDYEAEWYAVSLSEYVA